MSDQAEPSKARKTRVLRPPPPIGPGSSNQVINVTVGEDEDVNWTWTSRPDGTQFVSGYTIVKRRVQS